MNYMLSKIEGLAPLVDTPSKEARIQDIYDEEWETTMEYYEESGEGFGSSDMTYLIKNVIDIFLIESRLDYKTVFDPYLKVVAK